MKKFLIIYFLFSFFILLFFASGSIDSQDGFLYTAVARNIYYKGEPTAPFYDWSKKERENKNIPLNIYKGENGKIYTRTGLGYSLALIPAAVVTDIAYKYFGISPPVNFPLESDWLILMLASFTNIFFGAGLVIIMFLYFRALELIKQKAFFMSFLTLFTTNLFVLSKNSFAHIMFVTFLVLTFLLIKLYSQSKRQKMMYLAGCAFGIAAITYNMTFVLTIPPLIFYYLLLVKDKNKITRDIFLILMGVLPFIIIFFWYEFIRQEANMSFGGRDARDVIYNITHIPIGVFIEGLYGQLLSSGRSIFLYSPLLLIPIIFWHKIKKRIFPEVLVLVSLSIIYIIFNSLQYQIIKPEYGITGFWHGEYSWGPRYLSILIPFGMLLVGFIYQYLSKRSKILIFLPLIFFGLYVEILGVLMPYQTKFRGLDQDFFVNSTRYPVSIYSNFLPRYSPILTMSKNLMKLGRDFPKTFEKGVYNVRFYDGIDIPFSVDKERWRVIEGKGYISFDNKKQDPIKKISLGLINHPILQSSSSATLKFLLNAHLLLEESPKFNVGERNIIEIPIKDQFLKDKGNILVIEVGFNPPIKRMDQIFSIVTFNVNNHPVNIERLSFPYVSNLGSAMTGVTYQNYGGLNKDAWRLWDLHTQVYEKTLDFWWIKPFYYWDLPKRLFASLFIINIFGIILFGYLTFKKKLV